ncbi:unnamed protein product [Camellia sinensis]
MQRTRPAEKRNSKHSLHFIYTYRSKHFHLSPFKTSTQKSNKPISLTLKTLEMGGRRSGDADGHGGEFS